jgi:S-adenosylmethionine synthetase
MPARILPAEYVFPGHPDKLCDAIADAFVAEAIRREPRGLVGVEVAVHRNNAVVTGRIACHGAHDIDVDGLVQGIYRSAGYGKGWHPAPEEIKLDNQLCLGPLEEGEGEFRELSDDQAICIGYAINLPQTNYLPVEHWVARALARRLHRLRTEQRTLALGPDGKVIVFIREEEANWSLEGLSCSLQQRERADDIALHRAVRLTVEEAMSGLAAILPGLSPELPEALTVNGAGAFEVGGPEGDNGLSGKKLVVDAYGPRVAIGGGAWSGKDFFKADRAGGLHARRVAKLAVRLGLADEARVTLGWFPGDRAARVLQIQTEKGELGNSGALTEMVDLSLARSGERFSLPDALTDLARWGHFADCSMPWEKIDPL